MWAELTATPLFIGILNLTPDSFSDGGRFLDPEAAQAQAAQLVQAGARMLDVGGESTRPGAAPVDPATEWSRLEPVLSALRRSMPDIPLSLDTRHPAVAAKGLALGAKVLNDVTGFSDPAMLELAGSSACGLIAMRSRMDGAGFHMPPYQDSAPTHARQAIAELITIRDRLSHAGITHDRVLLDPGFGFGTTFQEDLAIWEALAGLPDDLDWPVARICLGLSRKRFLAARAGTPDLPPSQRDALTASAHGEALQWGYRVFRTHALG